MKALVDCNSFYCSCEKLFRPELEHKPIVVLSNNDGCIISRSDEAKSLGLGMTGPYFMAKDIIEANQVKVFSSNYNLYGDMSWRVMSTLKYMAGEENVEVYSVDEAFLDISRLESHQYQSMAVQLKTIVEKWTGIQVSVGVAPTKTLAKLANHMAKQDKQTTGCIMLLDTEEKITAALKNAKVGKLWGVGSRFAEKLETYGIQTAWDLYNVPEEWARKRLGGVVGVRLIKELHGEEAIVMENELVSKKMICSSRMFGSAVSNLEEIKEAIATYTSRAAEKLRRQHSAATVLNVFVVTREDNRNENFRPGETKSKQMVLPTPTLLTQQLIKPATRMAEMLYEKGRKYNKAGVILSGLIPEDSIQSNLFDTAPTKEEHSLMEMLDNINFSMRGDVVKFASSGLKRNWKMRHQFHSPRYTSRWDELFEVH
jgi:DNA polymerase V